MTYIEMKRQLENTRIGVKRVRMLSQRVTESIQVNQRLTAMYGKERVQSGGTFEDPTLAALIRMDDQSEAYRDELDEAMAAVTAGKAMIARMGKGKNKDILVNYYLMGWNYSKICRFMGWRSKSYVYKLLRDALSELYNIVK